METDASDTAIKACLLQKYEDNWHPVAYYSRKMTDTEQNYDIHNKELLAIIEAFKQWRVYAEGASDIKVFTDHKNLTTFTTTKELNRRQTRWMELLGQHKFKITYTPGKDNRTADGLSRRQDLYVDKTTTNKAILGYDSKGNLVPKQLCTMTMEPSKDKMQRIIQAYTTDEIVKEWKKERRDQPFQYCGKTYIPETLLEK